MALCRIACIVSSTLRNLQKTPGDISTVTGSLVVELLGGIVEEGAVLDSVAFVVGGLDVLGAVSS